MKNKYKELVANVFIFGVGNLSVKIIQLFLMMLYTSALTTSEYGLAELINNLVELVLPIIALCLYDGVFRFSIDKNYDRNVVFSISFKVITITNILAAVILIIFFIIFNNIYFIYFLFILLSLSYRQLLSQFARGLGYVLRFSLSGVINSIALLVFNFYFLSYLNLGVNGFLLSIIISNIISIIFIIISSDILSFLGFNIKNKKVLNALLVYSVPQIPNMLSWWITNISNRYLVLTFVSISAAGLFTAASKIPSIMHLVSSVFQQAWQFSSSKEIQKNGREKYFSNVFHYFSVVVVISCSVLMHNIDIVSGVLLKGDFYEARLYVPFLLISAVYNCYSIYYGTLYIANKSTKMLMITTLIGAIVSIIIGIITIPLIHVYGALVASNISYLVVVIIRLINTRRLLKVKFSLPFHIMNIIILYLQAAVLTIRLEKYTLYSLIILIFLIIFNIIFTFRYHRNHVSTFFVE